MNLLFVALDEQGYTRVKPLVDQLVATIDGQNATRVKTTRDEEGKRPYDLIKEEEELTKQIVNAANQVGKRKSNLFESDQEISAYDDLLDTIEDMKPESKVFLKALGEFLIPAAALAALHPRYLNLLSTVNLHDLIRNYTECSSEIPAQVYDTVLQKQKQMMEYAVANGFALLCIPTGEV